MAGERLGPAVAVRSAALSGGRMSFGGSIEARFGPALPRIGFPSRSTPEVNLLGSLPLRNNIPEIGSDSGKPRPSIRILGRIRGGNEARSIPDQVVQRTVRFQPYPVERVKFLGNVNRASNVLLFPGVEQVGSQPAQPEPVAEVLKNENRGVVENVIPFERGRARVRAELRPLVERSRTVNLNAIEQQLLLSRIMRSFARTRGLLRSQAIPMVSSEPQTSFRTEAGPVREIATNSRLTQVKNEVAQDEKSEIPVKLKVGEDIFARRRRRIVSIDQEKAVVDHKKNDERIKAVVAERDRYRLFGRDDARKEILAGAGITSRKHRSTILDLVDDSARDGGVVRAISDLTVQAGRLTDAEIEHTFVEHTAVKKARNGEEVSKVKLYEVIVDPEEPRRILSEEQILPKTRQMRVVNLETVRLREESKPVVENAATDEGEVAEESGLIQMSGTGRQDFVQPLVDRMVYIGSAFSLRTNIMDNEERMAA